MSKFYTSAEVYGNRVLLREVVNGKHVNREVDWAPTLYTKNRNGDLTSIYGDRVQSKKFPSVAACRSYLEEFKQVENFEIFGQLNLTLQFLNEYEVQDWNFGHISCESIDIETRIPESGFPDPVDAEAEVVLITMQNMHTQKCTTFGCKAYDGDDTNYRLYPDEKSLLMGFLEYWETMGVEIVTGWNIERFDIPYLARRIEKVLGKSSLNRLSPWKIVNVEEDTFINKKILKVKIVGVGVLDYLALMKKYTYGNRESWSLGSVAQEELGHTKLDHSEFKNFNEFMDKDWDKFVRYNIIDTKLVTAMDRKMKMIELALTVAYKAKINYQDVYSPVKTWDAIIHNALLSKGIVVPQRKETGYSGEPIHGGFVKTPISGMYSYFSAFDATSLYPSNMMTNNISPETYLGQTAASVESFMAGILPDIPDDVCVAPNGAMFAKDKQGIIPELIESFMAMRKKAKGEMLALKAEYEKTKDESLQSKIAALDNTQMAAKILMNSLYGALANKGFRFFNPDVAEAITTMGQLYLRTIDKRLSPKMSAAFGIPEKDYVIYADTDSLYISYEAILKKYVKDLSDTPKVIKMIEKIAVDKIQPLIKDITTDLAKDMRVYQDKIVFKLEIAADKGIFCSKKKYICRVYSSEGVTYAKPKYKVMGLEMVRSSTPHYIKDKIKDSLEIIFNGNEKAVQKYIQEVREDFMKQAPEVIAFPRGVNNIDEYMDKTTLYRKATPMHVRAAIIYNDKIVKSGLQQNYRMIGDRDKVKFIYMKEPNPLRQNTIAWPADDKLPTEFNVHQYVDYDMQFDKSFVSAMSIILEALNWSPVETSSLEDFFV